MNVWSDLIYPSGSNLQGKEIKCYLSCLETNWFTCHPEYFTILSSEFVYLVCCRTPKHKSFAISNEKNCNPAIFKFSRPWYPSIVIAIPANEQSNQLHEKQKMS